MAGRFRKLRHNAAYYLARIFLAIAIAIPRNVGLFIFGITARLIGKFLPTYRNTMLRNLTTIFGDTKTDSQKQKIVSGVFENLGKSLYDSVNVPALPTDTFKMVVKADTTSISEALKSERGVIVLGGHLSCFELQSHIFAHHDLSCITIGAPIFDKRIDAIVDEMRSRKGITYLHRDGAGRAVIKELKNNKIFIPLIDQDATNDGVFANFLGKLAFTPTGPIRIAVKYDIPLYSMVIERQKDNRYEIHFSDPIENPRTGDTKKDITIMAQNYNDFMSEQIMKYPEQWVWMHRRWKRTREKFPDIVSITDF